MGMDALWTPGSPEHAENGQFEKDIGNIKAFSNGAVPKWLRERSAKPLFDGSNPSRASKNFLAE